MKKVMYLLVVLLLSVTARSFAIDHSSEELLSLIKLKPEAATQEQVTSLLGKPLKVEEGKKRVLWYYDRGTHNLVISWNKKTSELEKFSFNNNLKEQNTYDSRLSVKLKSGVTNLADAIKILGLPKDMTIKEMTQEMHYAYKNSVLRLFFRNRMLVDYTLY